MTALDEHPAADWDDDTPDEPDWLAQQRREAAQHTTDAGDHHCWDDGVCTEWVSTDARGAG